jgi:fatty acid desaturase
MIIHGKVYDLKGFKHPGGTEILKLCKNEPDCTALFESYHAFCDMTKIKTIMKQYEVELSNEEPKPLFNFSKSGFYNICREKVKYYINERKNVKANLEWFKTVVITSLMFIFFQYTLLFCDSNGLNSISGIWKLCCSLMSGITLMSLGYNVLHDGSHHAISKYSFINKIMSVGINGLLLLNHTLWSYHHCIRHHQYTGFTKMDPDMRNSMPFLRKSKKIEKSKVEYTKKFIGFKLLFFNIIFPGTMFGQTLMYHYFWIKNKKLWKMKLPELFYDNWTILQYIISIVFCLTGLIYGGIYFLFHIIGTNIGYFIGSAPDHDMFPTHLEIENIDYKKDWGELQVRHSGNFMNDNDLFTKFYGGINYQIEHHLFPTLNNHKLKMISPIVQQCCKDFNIPYTVVNNPIDVFNQVLKTYETVHEENKEKK